MPAIPKLKNKNNSSSVYESRLCVNRWVFLVLTVPTFWLDISHLAFQIASYLICKGYNRWLETAVSRKIAPWQFSFTTPKEQEPIKQLLGGNTGADLNLNLMSQKSHIDSKPGQ